MKSCSRILSTLSSQLGGRAYSALPCAGAPPPQRPLSFTPACAAFEPRCRRRLHATCRSPTSCRETSTAPMPPVAHPPRAAKPPLPLCHLSLTHLVPRNLHCPYATCRSPASCRHTSPLPHTPVGAGLVPAHCPTKNWITIPPTAAHSPPDPFGPRIWEVPSRGDASRTIVSSQPALSSRAEVFVRQTTNGRRPSS